MQAAEQYTDLGHGISLIDAEYLYPGVVAVYLLQQQDQLAIIETGTANSAANILAVIEGRGFNTDDIAYIIPTHVHLDHAGGAGELMQHCQNAQLVIHPYGARHMIDPSKLIAGTIAVYGEEKFKQLYGELKPIDEQRVIEAPDNFELTLGKRRLRFLDTPGHARHHFCVYDEISQGIFTGDTFGLCYHVLTTEAGPFIFPTTTPIQFDPPALLQSIDRLMALKPKQVYLTHFGNIEPTDAVVTQLKQRIHDLTQIALAEKHSNGNRQENIERRLRDYLLKELAAMQCHQSAEFCEKFLRNDISLNAQGLEIWLERTT
jgi:glyoxylase-like metal-dependent hydrolase (beta-lactamase superfamily II)